MAEKTPSSPDSLELRGAPLASARLSKKAALVAVVVLAVILGVVIVNVSQDAPNKSASDAKDAPEKVLQPALNAAQTLTRDVPELSTPPKQTPPAAPAASQPPPLPASSSAPVTRVRSSADDARLADTAI